MMTTGATIAHAAGGLLLAPGSITASLANVATSVVGSLGLIGIFVLMLLDCACVPIPSEVTMLFAGFAVSRGDYSLAAVVIAGTSGNLVGSWLAYGAGRLGSDRLVARRGRRIFVHDGALERSHRWFARYGDPSVFVSRMLPMARTFISLPAGFARMPFWRFTALTVAGCIPWVLGLAIIGDVVGHNWTHWKDNLHYVDYAVVAFAGAGLAVLAARALTRRVRGVN